MHFFFFFFLTFYAIKFKYGVIVTDVIPNITFFRELGVYLERGNLYLFWFRGKFFVGTLSVFFRGIE